MAEQTKNYSLIKPGYEEFADIFAVKEFIERSYIENYM